MGDFIIGSAPPHDPIDIFVANPSFFPGLPQNLCHVRLAGGHYALTLPACAHVIFNKWCMTDQNLMWYLQHQILRTGDVTKSFSLFLFHGTLIKGSCPFATCRSLLPQRIMISKKEKREKHTSEQTFLSSPLFES